jgi:UDP-2,4-diacetamido-2,4,6-trideoxy-beta-L-altropyranose hydrolase
MQYKNKIAIRCIGEVSKGFGNFNRSLVLSKALKRFGLRPIFLINKNEIIIRELQKHKLQFVIIPKSKRISNEAKKIKNLLKKEVIQYIVFDMREYGEKLSRNFSNYEVNTILIDDAWVKKAYADMIVNGTPIRKYHSYQKINQDCKLLLGSKYWIIDENFRKNRKKVSEITSKKKYYVTISLGGSDFNNVTKKLVKSLLGLESINFAIVVGPFYKDVQNLKKIIKGHSNFTLIFSPPKIWKQFQKSDLVISAAGSTLFELATQGIPTLTIESITHQTPYAKFFTSKGFSYNLGWWSNLNYNILNKQILAILNDIHRRKKMHLAGIRVFDGKGSLRIANEIVNLHH